MSSRTLTILHRHPTTSLIVILLASMLMLRLWWGWQTGRMLTAEWDTVHERGEPVDVVEVTFPHLPDARDAWTLQTQAAGITATSGVDSPASGPIEYPNYPPYGAEWEKLAADSEAAHAQVFVLTRRARALEGQTRQALQEPLLTNVWLPSLNQVRNLANTLGDGALHRHFQGDDVEALQRVRDILHLSDSLRSGPIVVDQLVAIGIEALATYRLQVMAPGLGARPDPAARGHVEALIQRLATDAGRPEAVRRAFFVERLAAREMAETVSRGTWMIRPLADLDVMRVLRQWRVWLDAAEADNWADAQLILQRIRPDEIPHERGIAFFGTPEPTLPRYSRWFSTSSEASMERMFKVIFRQMADARMTAASLAINLYRADHGRWPASLEELVPKYLPVVPRDPFHADGRAIGYVMLQRADGAKRPMVFVDPGGPDEGPNDVEPIFGWQGGNHVSGGRMHEDARQYRDVSLWLPAERRWDRLEAERKAREEAEAQWEAELFSPEAVDDDPGEADAPGDQAQPEDEDQ